MGQSASNALAHLFFEPTIGKKCLPIGVVPMPFSPVQSEKLADSVIRQIEELILLSLIHI